MGWTNNASVVFANTVVVTAAGAGTGIFVYSGTPAAGNLIASLVAQAMVDPYGNQVLAGFTSYDPVGNLFSSTFQGATTWGHIVAGVPQTSTAGSVSAGTTALNLASLVTATLTDFGTMSLIAGATGQSTGSGTAPMLALADGAGSSAMDILVSGSVIKTTNAGVVYTWQTPSYGTNWAGSTSFNGNVGYHALQYRLDGMNNLHIIGCFAAGAIAPSNPVFTLPAGYRPAGAQPLWTQRNSGGTLSSGHMFVGTSGNVNVISGGGLGIAANDQFVCSGVIPLNTIP
jgi:hypothetical protein